MCKTKRQKPKPNQNDEDEFCMMTGTVIKKQKSDVIHHRSHMTQIQGSYCKGICRKHKSPAGRTAWSQNGVVFCMTCQTYLKKSGWFTTTRKKCKC